MNIDDRLTECWGDFQPPAKTCTYAEQFASWAEDLCREVELKRDAVTTNQAILRLCHRYWEWFNYVGRAHRYRIGDTGHSCIFHVFQQSFNRLKVVELSLTPPLLFIPKDPPVLPPIQIAGIDLGFIDR
jgi:hypothetical protein